MDDDVYDALFSVLSEAKSLSDWPKNSDTEVKRKYGEGKVSEEICPNCGKKFQCYSLGVFESGGALQVYSDDSVYCDVCQLHAEL